MSLTPTQLQELQTIVLDLGEEFPHNADFLWNAAIRIQKGDLGPVTGSGGVPAFEAAVADIKLCQEEVQNYQQRQGSPNSGFDVAVLQAIGIGDPLPSGNVGEVMYIETAPNTWAATDQILLTPAGPNSVQMDEVGTTVFRTVPAASGGVEINNLSTGAGFERALTTSDLAGAATPGGVDTNVQYNDAGAFGGDAALAWDDTTKSLTIDRASGSGWALNFNATRPSDTIIRMGGVGSGSTNYTALRMEDQTGGNFFLFRHDYGLSSPNHEFLLESSQFGTIWEIENEGNIYLQGTEGSSSVFISIANRVQIRSGSTLFIQETAAAVGDLTAYGQFWVRNDTPNTPMFTDDAGTDFVLSRGATVVAGTVENELVRWDIPNNQYEGAVNFGFDPSSTDPAVQVGIGSNMGRYEIVGTLGTPADKRAFFGFDGTTLRVMLANTTNSSDVAIRARDNVAGGTDRILAIFNPTADTLIRGEVTGLRLATGAGNVRILPGNVERAFFDNAGQLNLPGNGTQSGIVRITEGTSPFGDVAGEGQFWVRDDTPNVPMFTDDAGTDFVLNLDPDLTYLRLDTTNDPLTGSLEVASVLIDLNNSGAATATTFIVRNSAGGATLNINTTTGNAQIGQTSGAGAAEDVWLTMARNLGVTLYHNNISRLQTQTVGTVSVSSDTDTDAEVRRVTFTHQDGTLRGFVGYNGADLMILDNRIDGGSIEVQARDSGSVTRDILIGDPDAITELRGDTQVTIGLGPTPETGATFALGGAATLYFNDASQFVTDILGARVRDTLYIGNPSGGALKINELANADVDEAGFGQLWVEDLVPNVLKFTDDTGVDQTLGFVGCRLDNADGAQSVAGSSTYAPLSWGTTPEFETHSGFYDSATNDERIVIPTGMGGIYVIYGGVLCNSAGNADGTYWAIGLSRNGARVAEAVDSVDMSTVAFPNVGYNLNICSGPITLAAGDFLELETATDDTGSIGISSADRTFFSVMRVR